MQCKKGIMRGFHLGSCSRKAVQDGFCKQHHPDAVKKREEESRRRLEEQQKQSPWARLECCILRCAELGVVVKRLREWVARQPCKNPKQNPSRSFRSHTSCGGCETCLARTGLKGEK